MAAKKKSSAAAAKKSAAKRPAAKKAAAKKAPARKAAAKRSAAKKSPARKAAAKKVPARKAAAKRAPAKKGAAARRAAGKKALARKGPQRKPLTPKPQRMQQAMDAVKGVLEAVSNTQASRTAMGVLDAVTSAPGRLAERVGQMTHSSKPLAQKLRVAEGMIATVLGAPEEPSALLGPLPQGARISTELAQGAAAFVLVFVRNQAELAQRIAQLAERVTSKTLLWVAYPKQSSKVETDLTRDRGWEAATKAGFEGVAQVAVDAIWAATRLIKRG